MKTIKAFLAVALAVAPFGCELDVPDLNNPGIDQLEDNPTPSGVNAACTGLIIGNRRNVAQANGYVAQLGILGREAYNFDQADPRFIGELLQGDLNPGSPFGGNFWAQPYANIRLANIVERVTSEVPEFTAEQQSAIVGFAKTIEALDLLEVINTRDTNGAVIDTDHELDEELPPIEDKDVVLAYIADLLDEAATDLEGGGDEFTFSLSSGYAGFDTPPTFLTFNRGIRARVAAYMEDYATVESALAESFIDDTATTPAGMQVGVYHTFSTGAGDQVNNLINPNIYAHPSVTADLQAGDTRASKVAPAEAPGSAQGLTSDQVFTIYDSPGSPVAILKNEELILLRAEAAWAQNDLAAAEADLNLVRAAYGLAALTPGQTANQIEDEILYNRRYSLLFEGHRWIDVRRFGREADLPLDNPPDQPEHQLNMRYPIPLTECNARPDEPRCQ